MNEKLLEQRLAALEARLELRLLAESQGIMIAILDLHHLLIGQGLHTKAAAAQRLRVHASEILQNGAPDAAANALLYLAQGLEIDGLWMADAWGNPAGTA